MTILLNLPGRPVPEWLGFLLPLVVLVLVIKGVEWARHWYKQREAKLIHREDNLHMHEERNQNLP